MVGTKYSTSTRIPNFEILRTISMFFIVVGHCIIFGLPELTGHFKISNSLAIFNFVGVELMSCFVYVAVNCYVMITGYFLIDHFIFKIEKIEKVWLHTVFYTLILTLVFYIFDTNNFSIKNIISSIFVIRNRYYWFITNYIALIALAPFISEGISFFTKKKYQILLIILCLINLDIFGVPYGSIYDAGSGYTLSWFIFLFLVAGYIRLYNPCHKMKQDLRLYIISFLAIAIVTIVKICIRSNSTNDIVFAYMIHYNGLSFFMSIFFFLLFKNGTFRSIIWEPFIKVAPYTLGVYLLHEFPPIRHLLWGILYAPSQYIDKIYMIPMMIGVCLIIFIIGIIIDYVRSWIVEKMNLIKCLNRFNDFGYRLIRRK